MRNNTMLATALGLALIASPALAQNAGMPMQSSPQGGMGQPGGMMGSPMYAPQAGMMQGTADDDMGRMAAARMLEDAQEALRLGRTAEARNLLEQSETRLLSRAVPPGASAAPMRDPALDRLSAARNALQSRDRTAAMREMDQAMARLRSGPGMDSATGAGTMGGSPAYGGGGAMMGGQAMPQGRHQGGAVGTR
jgi:hypothetical protein